MNTIEKLDIEKATPEHVAEKLNEIIAQVNMLTAGKSKPLQEFLVTTGNNNPLSEFFEAL